MRIARFLVISAFAAATALPSVAEAQTAGASRLRRPSFNPYAALAPSRFAQADRFSAPAPAAAETASATTEEAPVASGSSFAASVIPMRPPFRPPVRSPFRPPPRPPW